jgi:hypothetical protein
MADRVTAVGGSFRIDTRPFQGARVIIPLISGVGVI